MSGWRGDNRLMNRIQNSFILTTFTALTRRIKIMIEFAKRLLLGKNEMRGRDKGEGTVKDRRAKRIRGEQRMTTIP